MKIKNISTGEIKNVSDVCFTNGVLHTYWKRSQPNERFFESRPELVKTSDTFRDEKSNKFPHTYFLDVVRQKFNELYILNEKSVSIQYNEESCPDECEYIDTFWEYVEKSKQMLNDNRKELTFNMMIFFNSILYQIDDEEMHMKASEFLYMCIQKLFKSDEDYKKVSDGAAWWGTIKK